MWQECLVKLFTSTVTSSYFQNLLVTYESQNHRMVGVGRDRCGSSSPTPLPKQGHLEQAAQDHVRVGLEYLQRRGLHNLSGHPVLQFVPVAPCPLAGHH